MILPSRQPSLQPTSVFWSGLCHSEAVLLAGFVRSAAKEKAQTLLEQESRVLLSKRDFAAFNAAISGAFLPNPALQKALKSAARVKRA